MRGRASSAHTTLRRAITASISSTRVSLTRGRPAGSPSAALVTVDRDPAGVVDELRLALADELLERRVADRRRCRAGGRRRGPRAAGRPCRWRPSCWSRSRRSGRAWPSRRRTRRGARRPARRPAASLAISSRSLVERHVRQRRAAVADRAEHGLRRHLDPLVGGACARRLPSAVQLELVARERHRLDAAPAPVERQRREQEAQRDAPRLPARRARGVLAQDLDVAQRRRVGVRVGDARRRAPARRGRRPRRPSLSSPSSRSSGLVNAACAGPRRATTSTSRTPLPRRAPRARGRRRR